MKNLKKSLTILLLLFSCLITLSCSNSENSESKSSTKPQKNILSINIGGEPSNLNPLLSTDAGASKIQGLIFNGLFRVNTELDLVPDLAESYTVSEDGLTYTFKLKQNVKWHDGARFSADDVLFTFDRLLDPKTNTVRRNGYVINGSPIAVKKIDSHTVEIKLPETFAPFLMRMAMEIIPKHLLENEDINTAAFNRNPIGTGPFIFETWQTAQYLTMKKNPNYFGDGPKLDGVIAKIIPDENTALVALTKGELHMNGIPPKEVEKMRAKKNIDVYEYEDLLYTYLAFNTRHPVFKDLKIRQAVAHAINKDAIVRGVLKGFGKPAHIPAAPVSWAYPDESTFTVYEYNPEKSKQLLKDAGYTYNKNSQFFEKDGTVLEYTIITNQGNESRNKAAQIIQQFMTQIGVKVNIQLMEWSAFLKVVNAPTDQKDFDAVILGWSLGLDPDAKSIWHSEEFPKGFNFVGYANKEVDRLIDAGRRELEKEKRKAIYAQMYTHIAEDLPYVFLYYPRVIVGVDTHVKGLAEPGPAGLLNPVENVFIK